MRIQITRANMAEAKQAFLADLEVARAAGRDFTSVRIDHSAEGVTIRAKLVEVDDA